MVELLVALGLGLLVAAWIIEALLAHSSFSAKLADRLHHREFERRARRLIEDDRRLASRATSQPGAQAPACNLAGRQPLLHLELPNGKPAITWTLGAAPSSIWRGQVLMRCGPAYGLDGQPTLTGSWQNRVVLDALAASDGFRAQPSGAGVLQLELAQAWADGGRLSSRLPVAIGANTVQNQTDHAGDS